MSSLIPHPTSDFFRQPKPSGKANDTKDRSWRRLAKRGVPGAQVTAVEYDSSGHEAIMRELLSRTDILVDATQRPDSSRPVIPNAWIGWMPRHAVIVDLSVDPYLLDDDPPVVRGIEGIPQGLDVPDVAIHNAIHEDESRQRPFLMDSIQSAEQTLQIEDVSLHVSIHPVPHAQIVPQ